MEENQKGQKLFKELLNEECKLNHTLKKLTEATAQRENVITALHDYNDMKDVTQIVLGRLADLHGTTVMKLHHQFNLIDK